MAEDEREALAKKLGNTPLYEGHGEESDLPEIAAEQIRADGERIKALEAALLDAHSRLYGAGMLGDGSDPVNAALLPIMMKGEG